MKIPIKFDLRKAINLRIFQRWAVVLLILLPVILGAVYIRFFGVNVVFWDQWDFIPYIEKLFNNNLSIYDLFQQHNEHRLFFPRIIMLILAYLTSYNNIYEMYFSWCLSIFILVLIFLMYRNSFGDSTKSLLVFIPISFMVFDFRQFENILWGFQLQVYLCVLGFILSIYMLEKSNNFNLNFLLAVFGGVLASYSFANGLAAWPTGLFFILISNKGKKLAIIWSLFGLLAAGLYFYNWIRPPDHPSPYVIIEQPIKGLIFLIANIGSPLAAQISVAVIIGSFLVVILFLELIILLKYNYIIETAKWLSFILFSLLSTLTMAIGRAGFGSEQALVSRYVTITFLSIIGIYLLALNIYIKISGGRVYSFLSVITISIIIIGVTAGYITGLEEGKSTSDFRTQDAYYLETCKLQTDNNLKNLYPSPEVVRERVKFLEKYKLNVFSNVGVNISRLTESDDNTLGYVGYVDAINGHIMNYNNISKRISFPINRSETDEIIINGWAVDRLANTSAKAVFIMIDNNLTIPTLYNLDRSDVARAFNNKELRYSGFEGSFAISNLNNGVHNLTLKVVSQRGDKIFNIDPDIQIAVKDGIRVAL